MDSSRAAIIAVKTVFDELRGRLSVAAVALKFLNGPEHDWLVELPRGALQTLPEWLRGGWVAHGRPAGAVVSDLARAIEGCSLYAAFPQNTEFDLQLLFHPARPVFELRPLDELFGCVTTSREDALKLAHEVGLVSSQAAFEVRVWHAAVSAHLAGRETPPGPSAPTTN